jgi:hypothetical protein
MHKGLAMGIKDIFNSNKIILTPGGRYPKSQVKAMEKATKEEKKAAKKRKKQ